ncbi:MAG TPA: serine hydrolase domain-containing protein [Pyrinomonadaceae bacterium]|nr:serine hydrolase domain-containing protein [Pyrinomonadaceae bacterium]
MIRSLISRFAPSFFVCLIAISTCAAQANLSARIDRYVKAEMSKQNIPGISLAVLRNGRVVLLRSYGMANVEHQVPVKPETIFQSGSIGKQFTAMEVMMLAEEGKLSLDDKITKFFSDAPAAWAGITIRHLLNHTSGLGDYPPEIELKRDYTEEELLSYFKKTPLDFEPGTSWNYSNVGYVMLGILIRKVTGKFYGDFLQERIFKPLGMTTARVISEADIVPNRAAGYRLVNGAFKNQEWVSPSTNSTADGSLYFSILDLARWDAALYTNTPLKQSSLNQMWAQTTLQDGRRKPYGFGWHTNVIHGRRVAFHGGAWQGFKSSIIRFLDDKLTIIFLANSWDTNDFKLTRGLAAIFYPKFALPATERIADREPQTSALVRRILNIGRSIEQRELFTPEFHSELLKGKARQLAASLDSLSLPVAVIHLSELVGRRDEGELRVYRYLLIDLGKTLSCTVKLTRDNKVASIELSEM